MNVDLPEQTVPAVFKSSMWRNAWFRIQLAVACFLRGRMHLFPSYFAQAVNETGGFTSYGFVKRRNAWGMRPAQQRRKWYRSDDNGFAVYSCYFMSAMDRISWDAEYYPFKGAVDAYFATFPYQRWYGGDVDDAEWLVLRDAMLSTALDYKRSGAYKVVTVGTWLLVAGLITGTLFVLWRIYKAVKR